MFPNSVKSLLKTAETLCVYAKSEQTYERLFSGITSDWLRYIRVYVVGQAASGSERVEELHPLGLLTQFWQKLTPHDPRNPAGGARRCNLIRPIQTQRDELPGTRLYLLLRLDLILIFLPSFSLSFSLRPVSNFSLSGIKTLIALLSVRYLRRCWVQCRRFMWWLLFACAPAWQYMQNCHGIDTSAPAVEHRRDICVIAYTTQLHVHSLL